LSALATDNCATDRRSRDLTVCVCVCVCVRVRAVLTEILPHVDEFLTTDLRHESLSESAEQKRRHYVTVLHSFLQQQQQQQAESCTVITSTAGN